MNILEEEGYKSITVRVIGLFVVNYEYINDKIYYWFVLYFITIIKMIANIIKC